MSLVGRPPTPPALDALRGHPGKRRAKQLPEPTVTADLTPPAELTGRARELWARDAPTLLIFKPAHRPLFARRCRLVAAAEAYFAEAEAAIAAGRARVSPAYWAALKGFDKAGAIEARFAMSPVDEARLHHVERADDGDHDNPLEALRQKHRRPA
jgi:hypothetical protein